MKCVFVSPITGNKEIGFINKKYYTTEGKKYDVTSEKGSFYHKLSDDRSRKGYVDLNLTKALHNQIHTNLDQSTIGNIYKK